MLDWFYRTCVVRNGQEPIPDTRIPLSEAAYQFRGAAVAVIAIAVCIAASWLISLSYKVPTP